MASYNGHDYVEIAGTKWATMNIGANSVTSYGQYFNWGDTAGYTASQVGSSGTTYAKPFNWADYKFSGGRTSPGATGMTKYNSSDGKAVLDLSDDAAKANWGGSWRIPTTEEWQALFAAVNTEWTEDYQDSGVEGLVCTDKTDSSKVLFFPAAGCYINGNAQSDNFYWSNSLHASYAQSAYRMYFEGEDAYWDDYGARCIGSPIRPVIG